MQWDFKQQQETTLRFCNSNKIIHKFAINCVFFGKGISAENKFIVFCFKLFNKQKKFFKRFTIKIASGLKNHSEKSVIKQQVLKKVKGIKSVI